MTRAGREGRGGRAQVLADGTRRTLLVDGLEASVVDLADPLYLEIPYMRRIAAVLEACHPRDVLHLGAGGCTLARRLAAQAQPGPPPRRCASRAAPRRDLCGQPHRRGAAAPLTAPAGDDHRRDRTDHPDRRPSGAARAAGGHLVVAAGRTLPMHRIAVGADGADVLDAEAAALWCADARLLRDS